MPYCHDTSVYLACSYQKARWDKCPSYNICLIGRNKREENFPSPRLPCYSAPTREDRWCFSLCQGFLKFRLEVKWKGLFWFLPTAIFRITPGGGPRILVRLVRPKFAVPFLTNRFTALLLFTSVGNSVKE